VERVLVGPPCRTTMPGIERPANARKGEDRPRGRSPALACNRARRNWADHTTSKDRNTAQGGNRVTQVR